MKTLPSAPYWLLCAACSALPLRAQETPATPPPAAPAAPAATPLEAPASLDQQATALFNQGKTSEAITLMRQFVTQDDHDPARHCTFGSMLLSVASTQMKSGDRELGRSLADEAEQNLQKATDLYTAIPKAERTQEDAFGFSQSFYLLGRIQENVRQNIPAAADNYQKALGIFPLKDAKEAFEAILKSSGPGGTTVPGLRPREEKITFLGREFLFSDRIESPGGGSSEFLYFPAGQSQQAWTEKISINRFRLGVSPAKLAGDVEIAAAKVQQTLIARGGGKDSAALSFKKISAPDTTGEVTAILYFARDGKTFVHQYTHRYLGPDFVEQTEKAAKETPQWLKNMATTPFPEP